MFETIGLFFAAAFELLMAAAMSAVLVGLTWLVTRNRKAPRKSLLLAAALIPILATVHVWLCDAMLPGKSLYGDISEPLPNGCTLNALGKMPDFGRIDCQRSPNGNNGPSEYIGKAAVYGPLVVGQYSHPFGSFDPNPNEPFFLFDTRDGSDTDLATQADLQSKIGHPVDLAEVQFFRSTEPSYLSQQRRNRAIEFDPPIIALQF